MPWPVIARMVQDMLKNNLVVPAMMVLTMFVTYCRPIEVMKLHTTDLVSTKQLGNMRSLNLNTSEEMETSKMGKQDETMLLDSQELPWLGHQLQLYLRKKVRSGAKMFPIEYFTFLKSWKSTLRNIGLPEDWAVPYQLRHSGASWDRFKKFRTQLEVKMRGRWAADSSMARYEKHAMLSHRFEQLPVGLRNECLWAVKNIKNLVQKSLGR